MPNAEQHATPPPTQPTKASDNIPGESPTSTHDLPIDSLARAGTYAIAIFYASGFLVISIYDARYGISDFSLLKVRALAAGACLAACLAVSALLGLRSFGIFGLRRWAGVEVSVSSEQEKYLDAFIALMLYPGCAWLAIAFGFLFSTPSTFPFHILPVEPGHFAWIVLGADVESALIVIVPIISVDIISSRFASRPGRCVLFAALISACWFIWGLSTAEGPAFYLGLWFYMVALVGAWIGHRLETGTRLRSIHWELIAVGFVPIFLVMYALAIYGNIKPAFGGGHPVTGRFYLHQCSPGANGRKTVDMLIIEETDRGYYAVKEGTKGGALFISRSQVDFVQLMPSERTPNDSTDARSRAPAQGLTSAPFLRKSK